MQGKSVSADVGPPSNQSLDCRIDFLAKKSVLKFNAPRRLHEDLNRVDREVDLYRQVLQAKGSIAKHFGLPLVSTRFGDQICTLFSTPYPQTISTNEDKRSSTTELGWLDLLREEVPTENFHQIGAGMYSCRVGNTMVEVAEADRNLICLGVVSKILRFPLDPSDLEKERVNRKCFIEDMDMLHSDCLRSKFDDV